MVCNINQKVFMEKEEQSMEVVNVKKKNLILNGFEDLSHWLSHPNHIYIGRDMSHYANGPVGSKWQNPFNLKKFGRDKCLDMYENYILTHSTLFSEIVELDGKSLGCWCHPEPCHGDVLIRLLQRQKAKKSEDKIEIVTDLSQSNEPEDPGKQILSREDFKELSAHTLHVLEEGSYVNQHGSTINLQKSIDNAVDNTVCLQSDDPSLIELRPPFTHHVTSFSTVLETPVEAAIRLYSEAGNNIVVLNIACPKQPGGGFLRGTNSQEECLLRSSALFECLKCRSSSTFYQMNKQSQDGIFTDSIIYSPDVPIFRDNCGEFLDIPCYASIISCSAVNRGQARTHFKPKELDEVLSTAMKIRIGKILQTAATNGHETLVLGAWGCGILRNEPEDVASWFHELLNGPFYGAFSEVVFAIQDSEHGKTFRAFQNLFNEKTNLQSQSSNVVTSQKVLNNRSERSTVAQKTRGRRGRKNRTA
mmetsp:Transcript_14731/g.19309  ORF Transcript_14731/g.19309 Transcript_14731/m.19309 type:complete len:475 (-) Transcript_14731:153-1577(-)